MEEYFQEADRAGRDGLPAKAHLYFNSYNISKGKKHFSETMRAYTQSKKCKREIILNYCTLDWKSQKKMVLVMNVVAIMRKSVIVMTMYISTVSRMFVLPYFFRMF